MLKEALKEALAALSRVEEVENNRVKESGVRRVRSLNERFREETLFCVYIIIFWDSVACVHVPNV